MMRIIAGTLKGRRLKTPTWDGLRPTSDKLRETLFNVLGPRVAGARVLDGFAGTGALGIESLSRGAQQVTFIEQDPRAAALIAENLEHCGIRTGYTVLRASLARGIDTLKAGSAFAPFDIVLLDPPYHQEQPRPEEHTDIDRILTTVTLVVAPAGLTVFEHARRRALPAAAGSLVRVREIVSGDSMLSFYQVAADH